MEETGNNLKKNVEIGLKSMEKFISFVVQSIMMVKRKQ